MTYELTDLELDEVSGVDTPANQYAGVVLAKRFVYTECVKPENAGETRKGDGSVTVEELTKRMEALQEQVADLTKRADEAEAAKSAAETAAAALAKSAEDAGMDVVDGKIVKRATPEYVEIGGEKVEKASVPAPVLEALEKAAADIAKMQAEAEDARLAKRGATELPHLAGAALVKGRLLKTIEGDAELLAALKAADAAMKGNGEEIGEGRVDNDMAEPARKLDRLADEFAAAKGVSREVAFAEITKSGEGYDLLRKMRQAAN